MIDSMLHTEVGIIVKILLFLIEGGNKRDLLIDRLRNDYENGPKICNAFLLGLLSWRVLYYRRISAVRQPHPIKLTLGAMPSQMVPRPVSPFFRLRRYM